MSNGGWWVSSRELSTLTTYGQLSWQWSLKLFNQWWSLCWASVPIADGWWIDHVWMVVGMFSEYCIDIKVGELYSSVLQPGLDVACVRTRENFVLFSVNHSARPLICLTFSSFSIFAKNCQETNRVSQRSAYLKKYIFINLWCVIFTTQFYLYFY